jgi:hypothetical protein
MLDTCLGNISLFVIIQTIPRKFFIKKMLTMLRPPNTDGWGNKLVTIFARHLDCFIMTLNFSLIYQFYSGSGQILQPRQLYLSPGFAKIAPWWLARRDNFSAKVPGPVSAAGATNVYSLNRRAVIVHSRPVTDPKFH